MTLLKHPSIADAAVIGVPSEDKVNELARAYVVPKPVHRGYVRKWLTVIIA